MPIEAQNDLTVSHSRSVQIYNAFFFGVTTAVLSVLWTKRRWPRRTNRSYTSVKSDRALGVLGGFNEVASLTYLEKKLL